MSMHMYLYLHMYTDICSDRLLRLWETNHFYLFASVVCHLGYISSADTGSISGGQFGRCPWFFLAFYPNQFVGFSVRVFYFFPANLLAIIIWSLYKLHEQGESRPLEWALYIICPYLYLWSLLCTFLCRGVVPTLVEWTLIKAEIGRCGTIFFRNWTPLFSRAIRLSLDLAYTITVQIMDEKCVGR